MFSIIIHGTVVRIEQRGGFLSAMLLLHSQNQQSHLLSFSFLTTVIVNLPSPTHPEFGPPHESSAWRADRSSKPTQPWSNCKCRMIPDLRTQATQLSKIDDNKEKCCSSYPGSQDPSSSTLHASKSCLGVGRGLFGSSRPILTITSLGSREATISSNTDLHTVPVPVLFHLSKYLATQVA